MKLWIKFKIKLIKATTTRKKKTESTDALLLRILQLKKKILCLLDVSVCLEFIFPQLNLIVPFAVCQWCVVVDYYSEEGGDAIQSKYYWKWRQQKRNKRKTEKKKKSRRNQRNLWIFHHWNIFFVVVGVIQAHSI